MGAAAVSDDCRKEIESQSLELEFAKNRLTNDSDESIILLFGSGQ
jgi:hypothetical protein